MRIGVDICQFNRLFRDLWILTIAPLLALSVFVSQSDPAFAANGSRWLVRPEGVVLRKAPLPTAPVLVTLAEGRRLVEFERQGDWLRVLVMDAVGLEGWVRAETLSEIPLVPLPEASQEPPQKEPPVEPPQPIVLSVGGSPALAFSVDCSLLGSSGRKKSLRFEGLAPKRYSFTVPAVSCLVRKEDSRGRLKANLSRDGRILAAAETAAAYNHVRLRSKGPWGGAGGWRGAIPQVQHLPGNGEWGRGWQSPSVPPLGSPVPPLRQY